jgi:hypothetical protein
MAFSAFDPAKFVSEMERLGAELRPVNPVDGPAFIKISYGLNAPRAHIDALYKAEMTSPERCRAVLEFLEKRP